MTETIMDRVTPGQVFGDPVVVGGLTVLPVVKVAGGAQSPENGSGGSGVTARGYGVFVVKGDDVAWRPALDVNRVILGGQLVAVAAFLLARALIQARSGGMPDRRPPRARRSFVRGGRPRAHTSRRCAPAAARRQRHQRTP